MKVTTPTDCLGNELHAKDLVAVQFATPPIFRIAAVENGGIQTPQGPTPALVRIVCDMTLRQLPGLPFIALVRVVERSTQQILEAMTDLPRT